MFAPRENNITLLYICIILHLKLFGRKNKCKLWEYYEECVFKTSLIIDNSSTTNWKKRVKQSVKLFTQLFIEVIPAAWDKWRNYLISRVFIDLNLFRVKICNYSLNFFFRKSFGVILTHLQEKFLRVKRFFDLFTK